MRISIDSNVLVYAFQRGDPRAEIADDLLRRLADADVMLCVQVLGELLKVVRRKYSERLEETAFAVGIWSALYPIEQTTIDDILPALEIAERYRLQYWDSLIIAVAARGGAEVLLTEDMGDGTIVHGVRLLNPFKAENQPVIDALLTLSPGTA